MSFQQLASSCRIRLIAPLLVALLGVALAQTSMAGAALTNDDIVKMASLGFGDDVIEAKIKQASAVSFKLEVDDLQKLKSAGVSQGVISAMLSRSSAGTAGGEEPAPGSPSGMVPPYGFAGGMEVKLATKDHGELTLRAMSGSMSSTFAYVTTLIHINYPGLKSDVRTQDPRPTLLIRYRDNPKGSFYLVSAEVDSRNNVRSVKMGNSRLFGMKNAGAPDSDNQIDYDAVPESNDTWRITPKKDLRPGEYGMWRATQMYDFGVDP